jgi:hypothetical protein
VIIVITNSPRDAAVMPLTTRLIKAKLLEELLSPVLAAINNWGDR